MKHSSPLLCSLLLLAAPLAAQTAAFDTTARRSLVDSLATNLVNRYVFPEVGEKLAADLRARLAGGEYDQLSQDALATRLTEDLRQIAHDRHLRVSWIGAFKEGGPTNRPDVPVKRETFLRSVNYGFEKAEILPGNVGLLEIGGFLEISSAREAALAAMRKLGEVDALIIDLRKNGGGEPETVALVSTFLFPKGKRVHLNDLHWREGNRVDQYYTDPDLDIPRITGPVYVLTSRNTFSAAEEFTYNLKQLKRATQVGETTGGGANPGQGVDLFPGFVAFVPTGRAVNPITKDNWEGKGCVPEVPTTADEALHRAHRMALIRLGREGT